MTRFKVKTQDTILFVKRVFVLEATSLEAAKEQVKRDYPNSYILAISEEENEE
jgi:glycerol-3-phosphate responsive antiterminator